jgi:hypothetical protein
MLIYYLAHCSDVVQFIRKCIYYRNFKCKNEQYGMVRH